jgi:hypothetical protein
MISCITSVAWSHPILSLCCTEHGSSRGAVLSGHITTVAACTSCRCFSNTRACLGNKCV